MPGAVTKGRKQYEGMEKSDRAVTAGALLAASLAGCSGDGTYSADMAEYAYEKGAPSLCQAYEDYFQVGAAINPRDLEEGSDRYKIIDKQFNVFTLENGTKAENIHPQEDVYDFEATDQLVEYGQANGKTVRGHTLVWYSQCPEWFFLDDQGDQVSAEVLIQRMKEHITTIVSRYKGKIHTWDVCNEVLDDSFGLRQSEWLNIIGDYDGDGDSYDYIEIAFQTAHEADPDAASSSTTTPWSQRQQGHHHVQHGQAAAGRGRAHRWHWLADAHRL